jgi:hypothetical protein
MVDLSKLSPEAKEARKKRLEDKAIVTARISETCRYVSFGILAAFYTLHTGTDKFSTNMISQSGVVLDVMALGALLSLICDYLQYYFASKSVQNALDNREDQLFDQERYDYRLRQFFYHAKQILMFAAAILLLAAMTRTFIFPLTPP